MCECIRILYGTYVCTHTNTYTQFPCDENCIYLQNLYLLISYYFILDAYYFRMIEKLCFVSVLKHNMLKDTKLIMKHFGSSTKCSRLFHPLVVCETWNKQRQQGLKELQKIRESDNQTVALGWIPSAHYEQSQWGRAAFLTNSLPSLTICVVAQPNPVWFFPHSPFHLLTFLSSH